MVCGTVSAVGGLMKAIDNCVKLKFDGTQIYTTSSRRWISPLIMEKKAEEIRAYAEEKRVLLLSHVPFLVNLATPSWKLYNKSIERLRIEIISCGLLGIRHLVFHPGNHMDGDKERAMKQLLRAITEVLPLCEEWDVILCYETMSGVGTQFCSTEEEILYPIDTLKNPPNLKICLDTAHMYAAGIDIKSFIEEIDCSLIGMLHLNNTKVEFGKKLDRHSSIFDGNIPLATFEMLTKRFSKIPKVLEFNADDPSGPEQISYLKGLL